MLSGGRISECAASDAPRTGSYGHTRHTGVSAADGEAFVTYAGPWFEARLHADGDPDHRAIRASLTRNCADRFDFESAGQYFLPPV